MGISLGERPLTKFGRCCPSPTIGLAAQMLCNWCPWKWSTLIELSLPLRMSLTVDSPTHYKTMLVKALVELHFALTLSIMDQDSKMSGGNDVYTPELYSIEFYTRWWTSLCTVMYVTVYGQHLVAIGHFWRPSLTLPCISFVWSTVDRLNCVICFILICE